MDFQESARIFYTPNVCEVERVSKEPENFNPLIFDLMDNNPQTLVRRGQIAKMSLPNGFEHGESKERTEASGLSYDEYHPAGKPDAMLCFLYRGKKVNDAAADSFKQVLEQPPHSLSHAELSTLKEIVKDKANPGDFNVLSARTEDIQGKRVLLIEGRYKANQEDSLSMYVDACGDGKSVQEIFFQAPKHDYSQLIKSVRNSFKTIEWQ